MTQTGSTRFLIVGAAGSHGATGNHAARQHQEVFGGLQEARRHA
jgi:hypothetical protein